MDDSPQKGYVLILMTWEYSVAQQREIKIPERS